jgi:acyl-CoA thioesterase FadM
LAHRVEADGELAAEGDGVLVHYDYATQSSLPILPAMRAKIEAFERATFSI